MNRNNGSFDDYLAGLDTKTFSSSKKEIDRTYRAVMKKAGLKRKAPKAKRIGRVCLIAAAAVTCTAVTAAAAGFNVGELFRGYFEHGTRAAGSAASLTQSQILVLDKSGKPVGQSVTDNGTTITVKAIMGDKSKAYLLLDVTAPVGSWLKRDDYDFEEDRIDFHHQNGEGSSSTGWDLLSQPDANPNDNKKTFLLRISSVGLDLQGRNISLSLVNLSIPGKEKLSFDPVIKGTWKFDFTLDYPTASKELTVNRVTHYKGCDNKAYEYIVKRVSLSAFSVIADLSGKNMTRLGIPSSITIRYRNGTQATLPYPGGAGCSTGCTLVKSFDKPVDIDSISSVTIGDLTVPVS